MRQPWPWYSETRSGGGWFVKLGGDQHFLGKHPAGASAPEKKNRKWNLPTEVLEKFYQLMALRDTASKSDYAFETICALYIEELTEQNAELTTRYDQILGDFCDHEYKGRQIGKLLVNAELEAHHLKSWVQQFPSDQTQRTYINFVKAVLNWAVSKKAINVFKNPIADLKAPKIQSRAVVITREEHEGLLKLWKNDCYCDFLQAM